jgi:hypothetical protein
VAAPARRPYAGFVQGAAGESGAAGSSGEGARRAVARHYERVPSDVLSHPQPVVYVHGVEPALAEAREWRAREGKVLLCGLCAHAWQGRILVPACKQRRPRRLLGPSLSAVRGPCEASAYSPCPPTCPKGGSFRSRLGSFSFADVNLKVIRWGPSTFGANGQAQRAGEARAVGKERVRRLPGLGRG